MKKIVLSLLLIGIAYTGFAQCSFQLGLKTGLNNSKITVNRDQFTASTINNFHIGAYARLGINRLYVQPEAYYISKGGDIRDILSVNPLQTISSFNYDMVDVPILLGVKAINGKIYNVRAMAGPVFSFVTNSSIRTEDPNFSTSYFKNNFIGWQYGLGVDVLFVTLDARIERSAGNVYSSSYLRSKDKTFLLTIGIKIL